MADLADPNVVNAMIQATPGSVAVSYAGVDGFGHPGVPAGMAFADPELSVGRPSVVVASNYFPRIGADPVDGVDGIVDTEIQVGEYVYAIARAERVGEDGGETFLLLTDPT